MSRDLLREAEQLLYHEAALLDEQRFEEWVDLFTADCVFWAPAWIDDETLGDDPKRFLSHIFYDSRDGLADRAKRLRAGDSLASSPTPRTLHAITNIRLLTSAPEEMTVASNAGVDRYDLRTRTAGRLFARYTHRFAADGGRWRIAEKRIVILNDLLPGAVDINSI
jgi:3-phenylpropionate/cinnamic acid dioxygenase small subunit